MSAFIMSTESLSSMAARIKSIMINGDYNSYQLRQAFGYNPTYEHIFRELYRINELSVNERYNESSEDYADIKPAANPKDITKAQMIKKLHCWMYQSCELEGYEDNEIYKAMYGLAYSMMGSRLSEIDAAYNNAEWD